MKVGKTTETPQPNRSPSHHVPQCHIHPAAPKPQVLQNPKLADPKNSYRTANILTWGEEKFLVPLLNFTYIPVCSLPLPHKEGEGLSRLLPQHCAYVPFCHMGTSTPVMLSTQHSPGHRDPRPSPTETSLIDFLI